MSLLWHFHKCILCILCSSLTLPSFIPFPTIYFHNPNHLPLTFMRLSFKKKMLLRSPYESNTFPCIFDSVFFILFSFNMNLITLTIFLWMTWFWTSLWVTKPVHLMTFSLSSHLLLFCHLIGEHLLLCHSVTQLLWIVLQFGEGQNTVSNYMHVRKQKGFLWPVPHDLSEDFI